MVPWRAIVTTAAVMLVSMGAEARQRPARVAFELFYDQGIGSETQRWYQLFTDLGVENLRIRGVEAGDEIGIEDRGKPEAPSYKVTGRITANNTLMLPGGKFSARDSVRLKQWLKTLSEQGIDGVTGKPALFGLTETQYHEVEEDLKRPVDFSTKDLPNGEAVERIGAGLRHSIEIAPDARAALAKRTVAEDLAGFSAGTALALVLRPAGLVFAPVRTHGTTIAYRVAPPASGHDAWPVGWTSEKPDRDLLPDLFKFTYVEIDETPVSEAAEAIQQRLKVPFLWDHFALDGQGIDPAKTTVKLPTKKLHYGLILSKVLSQAKLQKELRVDEAGKPFLWITPQSGAKSAGVAAGN